jgi:1-deoxy-D-xylulose-5-phosphate reductoisomerase
MRRIGLFDPTRERLPVSEPVKTVILGATGSIGTQTIELALAMPERLRITGLSTNTRIESLRDLVLQLKAGDYTETPQLAVVDAQAHARAQAMPELAPHLLPPGKDGLPALAGQVDADVVVNGLVGAAGLEPTLAAAKAGRRIALANKESLVIGGDLVAEALAQGKAEIIPVDSEHSALAQCLSGRDYAEVDKLILTASGGPFRGWQAADLASVSREQVLKHPTWEMGHKITVDSATLMNKGLEIIEAHMLFGVSYEDIDVLVHPGSIVHSLVLYVDGSLMAQLGFPDMKLPILYAIAREAHWPLGGQRLDLAKLGQLVFEAPQVDDFPCLRLAREAGLAGGTAPIVLNGANEIAVAALLADKIQYIQIARIIEEALAGIPQARVDTLEDALDVDRRARTAAEAIVDDMTP